MAQDGYRTDSLALFNNRIRLLGEGEKKKSVTFPSQNLQDNNLLSQR